MQFTINGLTFGTFIPRLPEIQQRVDVSVGALGWILALGTAASVVSSLRTGAVLSRFRTRDVLVTSASLSTLALVGIGVAQHPAVLVASLMLFAANDVFADVSMNMFGSDLSARRHAPVMNRLHGMWSLGTMLGGFVTALMVRWGVAVPVHLGVTAVLLVVAIVFVRSNLPADLADPVEASDGRDARVAAPVGVVDPPPRSNASVMSAGRVRVTVALGVGGFAAIALEIVSTDWATFRLGRDLGAADGVAVAGFVAFTVGMMVGRFGGDSIQVRVGRLRMTDLAGSCAVLGASLATLVASVPVALCGLAILGLGTSVLFPQLYDAAAKAPGRRGDGFTALLIGQRIGTTVLPVIVASLADTARLDFGGAMALLLLPAALVVLAGGRTVVRLAPTERTR